MLIALCAGQLEKDLKSTKQSLTEEEQRSKGVADAEARAAEATLAAEAHNQLAQLLSSEKKTLVLPFT